MTKHKCDNIQIVQKKKTKQALAELGQAQPSLSSPFLILPILGADISLQTWPLLLLG